MEAQAITARGQDDAVSVLLRFADGSTGTIVYSSLGDPSVPKEYIEAFAEGRAIRLDDFCRLDTARGGKSTKSKGAQDKGQRAMVKAFLEATRGKAPPPISLAELAAVSEATLAITESLRAWRAGGNRRGSCHGGCPRPYRSQRRERNRITGLIPHKRYTARNKTIGNVGALNCMHERKSILVTGGAGFLGSHLCDRLLADGHDVICADNFFTGTKHNIDHLINRPRFELIRHDVTFPLYIEVDEIYNLACPASPIHYQHDPVQTTKTPCIGAINMLGLAKRLKVKIFQASTSEVYGDPAVHPQREDYWGHVNPIGPRSCYDEGKRCAETLFFDYNRQNGLEIKVARIFNTYGPRMHPNDGRVVSNFIVQALKGEANHDLRRGDANPLFLLCGRSDRRVRPAHGNATGRDGPR